MTDVDQVLANPLGYYGAVLVTKQNNYLLMRADYNQGVMQDYRQRYYMVGYTKDNIRVLKFVDAPELTPRAQEALKPVRVETQVPGVGKDFDSLTCYQGHA